jgi:cytochrome c oxidase subunit 2
MSNDIEKNTVAARMPARRRLLIGAFAAVALLGAWFGGYLSDDDIDAGDESEQPTLEELVMRGREPYLEYCSACHKADGKGEPGAIPPLDGSAIVRGRKSRHVEIVLLGKPGAPMPGFKDQLDDETIAAILTYERNAWFFKALNSITPAEVAAMRAKLKLPPAAGK